MFEELKWKLRQLRKLSEEEKQELFEEYLRMRREFLKLINAHYDAWLHEWNYSVLYRDVDPNKDTLENGAFERFMTKKMNDLAMKMMKEQQDWKLNLRVEKGYGSYYIIGRSKDWPNETITMMFYL